ncbi:unnamed protein product [Vitrella brassicaformis CCMP3155]|uniref:HIG1 domain-containing protein n=1 Tax=Vitrella brassicaformis (strain CCMP3155) TaxID=1169540 RepID=A0A0G4G8K3_VITBC|nr:unnamed protein product [Vitrella brassicaformis CCMP3155]|eukprot:CEM25130.1 unnamed protein product [Vitrella brassicaformis CCMP3155]
MGTSSGAGDVVSESSRAVVAGCVVFSGLQAFCHLPLLRGKAPLLRHRTRSIRLGLISALAAGAVFWINHRRNLRRREALETLQQQDVEKMKFMKADSLATPLSMPEETEEAELKIPSLIQEAKAEDRRMGWER